jgi:hypothetical protein
MNLTKKLLKEGGYEKGYQKDISSFTGWASWRSSPAWHSAFR